MLNVKAFGVASGMLWAIAVVWAIVLAMIGKGIEPFNLINQFYLNLLTPGAAGLVFGAVLAFVDGFIAAAIFAWIYNKLSGCCCKKVTA
jgi:hypothetical protein